MTLEEDVEVDALGGVEEVQEPGSGARILTKVPIRIGGENGVEGAESSVREVLGKVGADLVRGGTGIKSTSQGSPPRRGEREGASLCVPPLV